MWVDLLHVIVVGFVALFASRIGWLWLLRQPGYIPLFVILVVGTFSLYVADMVHDLYRITNLCMVVPDSCVDEPLSEEVRFAIATLLALVGAVILIGRKFPSHEAYRFVSQIEEHHVEVLLQDSFEEQYPVELTMENGKVYVALPLVSGISAPGQGDVAVIPFMSGYRDKDTKELRPTTFYVDLIGQWEEITDFLVVLPKNKIHSARRFDLHLYFEVFAEEDY